MKRADLVGQTFGSLTVMSVAVLTPRKQVKWLCRCVCGRKTQNYGFDLKRGRVVSCGRCGKTPRARTHGASNTKTYAVWAAMLQRCLNRNDKNYAHYGGRGISVCDSWRSFAAFLADMGEKPEGMTLDRVHNDRGYEKSNCRWATRIEQQRNKRNTVHVIFRGTRVTLQDVIDATGVSRATLHYQIKKHGLTHQEALDRWLHLNQK